MNKTTTTYNLRSLLISIFLIEVVFWSIFYLVVSVLGFLGADASKSAFHFLTPEAFYLLIFTVPLAYLFWRSVLRLNQLNSHYSLFSQKGVPKFKMAYLLTRYFLLRSAFVFLIIALAQPIYGKKKVKGTVKSMELVICLDISNSMNTMDIDNTPRLEIAKRALNALVNTFAGEKVGLCVFAGNAYAPLQLTTDYNAAKIFINDVNTGYLSNQGTNVPAALQTAMEMFSKEEIAKAVFVITDGENHEAGSDDLYEQLRSKGIQVLVLGVGTEKGGSIPIDPNFPDQGSVMSAGGKQVISTMNPQFVKEIATKSGGVAMITSEPYPDIEALLTQINQMKRVKLRNLEFDIEESRYRFPLLLALICWLLWMSLPYIAKHKK